MTYRELQALLEQMSEGELNRAAMIGATTALERVAWSHELFSPGHSALAYLGPNYPVLVGARDESLVTKKPGQPDDWYERLPQDLRAVAYRSAHELAWRRKHALEVLEALHKLGYRATGIEVWIPTTPGPTIPSGLPQWEEGESALTAAEYIRDFCWMSEEERLANRPMVFNIWAELLESN